MKHYAKKRELLTAVQWTGEMTPEVTEFLQGRAVRFAVVDGRLEFANSRGPGRFVDRPDWIMWSSEGLVPVGDADVRRIYDEVDETGRSIPSTGEEHEAAGREFVLELDALLAAGLKLTREEHAKIFADRDRLVRTMRHLMEDHAWHAERRERARIVSRITKEIL